MEDILVLDSFDFINVALLAITDLPFNLELSNFLSASSVC